jgi:membrane-associated protease RseP (regulator of RpoE activity)
MRIFLAGVPVLALTVFWTSPTTALLLRSAASLAKHPPRYGGTRFALFDTSSPPNNDYSSKEQSNGLGFQRKKLEAALECIDALQESIEQAPDAHTLAALEVSLCQVEETVSLLELVSPSGLLSSDYDRAIRLFLKLPLTSRLALCEALEISDSGQAASDWDRVPDIVSQLYEDRFLLTSQRLQDALKTVESRRNERRQQLQVRSSPEAPSDNSSNLATRNKIRSIFDGSMNEEEVQSEGTVQQLLGRVTRKEGRVATPEDLNELMLALGKDTFVASGKEAISGGYIIRGRNVKKSGEELIEALDAKLPVDWSAQVSILPDVTRFGGNDFGSASDPVLLLLKKDMSATTSRWILSFTTAAAVVSAYLFSVGVYGGNDIVTSRLTEMADAGQYTGLTWFNGKVLEVMLPLGIIQALHQLGHNAIAARDDMQVSPPTLLPFLSLPFMGAQTQLEESPKNRSSLFDFAFVGPFVGILASLAFLVVGLQSTSMDPEAAQFLPALPVSVIKLSSLGGAIVDYFMGGDGSVTLQDPNTAIYLHPYAIAGFTSLMINSLDLLPLGSTDGGRMSLSLLGRKGHSVLGGSVWGFLLISSLFQEHADVLVGAWIVNNIVENDPEVPCRNEVDPVNVPRVFAASCLWLVGILALVPMA